MIIKRKVCDSPKFVWYDEKFSVFLTKEFPFSIFPFLLPCVVAVTDGVADVVVVNVTVLVVDAVVDDDEIARNRSNTFVSQRANVLRQFTVNAYV